MEFTTLGDAIVVVLYFSSAFSCNPLVYWLIPFLIPLTTAVNRLLVNKKGEQIAHLVRVYKKTKGVGTFIELV